MDVWTDRQKDGCMIEPRIHMTVSVSQDTYKQLHKWAEQANMPVSRVMDKLVVDRLNGKNKPKNTTLDYSDSQA